MIRGMVEKNWSLKKRWPLFAGGIVILMLVYHGGSVVESTYISEWYWSYKVSPPPEAERLVEESANDFINKLNVSVGELRDPNIDEYQMVHSDVIDYESPMYLERMYNDIKRCFFLGYNSISDRKMCLIREYILDKNIPYTYDYYIDFNSYDVQIDYMKETMRIDSDNASSVLEHDNDNYLNKFEIRWLKARGEKEIWQRVQEKFRWD